MHRDLATSSVPDLIPKINVGHYGKPNGDDVGAFPRDIPMDTVADSKEPTPKVPAEEPHPEQSDM